MKKTFRLMHHKFHRRCLVNTETPFKFDFDVTVTVTATVRHNDVEFHSIPSFSINLPEEVALRQATSITPTPEPGIQDKDPHVPSGEHFMDWLRQALHSHQLIMNAPKALVHVVSDSIFLVSPGLFQRYAQEHLQLVVLAKQEGIPDWQWIQKRFEKLRQHHTQLNGLNIWDCLVSGSRKPRLLHGYLLIDHTCLMAEIPPNNPSLTLCSEELDVEVPSPTL